MTTIQTIAPRVVRATLENSRWDVRGNLVSMLLPEEETSGAVALLEITEWPGAAPPRHIHHREDELFYVLEGELTVEVDGRAYPAPAGTLAFVPRGTAHGLAVESERVKLLVAMLPAGLEGAFVEGSRPAAALDMPGGPDESFALTPEMAQALADRYGSEVVGPPVEARRR